MNVSYLQYLNGELYFGLQPKSLRSLISNYTSPVYVYDLEILKHRAQKMREVLPNFNIHYAVKANFHPRILQTLKEQGLKVDTVSGGEIRRAMENGFAPGDIVFSGVGKTVSEIDQALKDRIFQINIESPSELTRIQARAEALGKKVSVAFRINPDVDIKTHPYIATGLSENKFGIGMFELPALMQQLKKNSYVELKGLTMHLGSQMTELSGLKEGLHKLRELFESTRREFPSLERFDIGGGVGIFYSDETATKDFSLLEDYGKLVQEEIRNVKAQFQTEPGRWLTARMGGLLAQVQYIKSNGQKKFVILDAGMNLLMRPTLYGAFHRILPVKDRGGHKEIVDVVGPICESSDFFAKNREISALEEGDFVWIADAGAYGAVMASGYNLQPGLQEVFI